MLMQLLPKAHQAYRSLPILGRFASEFADWCHKRGYSLDSVRSHLNGVRRLAISFNRSGCKKFKGLTPGHFARAWRKFRKNDSHTRAAVRLFRRFLEEIHHFPSTALKPITNVERELQRYKDHLGTVRGLAEQTIECRVRCARVFLSFIGYNRCKTAIVKLSLNQIEAFVRQRSKTCRRSSLKQIIGRVRSFLRYQYSDGKLPSPLHAQIETPRIYREEQLPRALPWPQVQALLRDIDRRAPHGLRDYTMLYLMAACGLRSCEVVALTLDDIDWRAALLRIPQRKTKRRLILPMTDEMGDVLQCYLQEGRQCSPENRRRELFLSHRAPRLPLAPQALREIFNEQVRRSGLAISPRGTHSLRHSFALRLMQQGVSVKTIGDTLGHRGLESTGIYLRLAIDDLREASAPVPKNAVASTLLKPDWEKDVPRLHFRKGPTQSPPTRFRSHDRAELQRYLDTKKALGRKYINETRILLDWDAFLLGEIGRSGSIEGELFSRWTNRLDHLCPRVRRHRMETVRNFLLFHARDHHVRFIPDLTAFPRLSSPKPPRLISEQEMGRILATTKQLPPSSDNPLRPETLRIALLLLFCCGIRRGELLRLRLRHLDLVNDLLHIEDTKFHKSRLVPFSSDVGKELRDYLELRRQRHLAVEEDSYLFLRRVSRNPQKGMGLSTNWRRLCLTVGVVNEQGRPAHLHDLRHSAAVNALQRWYSNGENVQAKVPRLAVYLGHLNLACTHYYLHLTPKLREAASQRFHKQCSAILLPGGEA